ncbi:LuxR C-terminal-related transcriptional regulator [Bradyrhizobium erythrophlei]|uniref:LuxR C-terminal-related transcriptional regulator n=1 Tax=Bradyrhizobium erythrophlei TaxID=1437360 RepID=UPI0035EFA754
MRDSFAIVLIGNHSLLREGVARILRSAKFRIMSSVSCADDFLCNEVQQPQPLFLIVHTGDDFDVVAQQIELLRRSNPCARIAIVADRYRLEELASAFRTGANGYFAEVTPDVFIKSMELLMMGETVVSGAFLAFVFGPEGAPLDHADPRAANSEALLATPEDAIAPQLSPREKSIVRCLVDGDSNKSIARKFHITVGTVKSHVKAILRKIRVRNRTQAAIWGMRNGWPARTTSTNQPPRAAGVGSKLPAPGGHSGIAQIDRSDQPDANLTELPRRLTETAPSLGRCSTRSGP